MTKTGGVLAAIIGRTLSLNANIDVTGKGFKGGVIASGPGNCIITNAAKLGKYAYSGTSDSSGFKGESLASKADPSFINTPPFLPVFPLFAKGRGKNFNGGGGGNGKFSGGGGGSNYGAGGSGGHEAGPCTPIYFGGLGGVQIPGTGLDGGLFPGGGGGASTSVMGGTPSAGANGGGIIILICDTLKGNGYSILADGATPSVTASGDAGSGGGEVAVPLLFICVAFQKNRQHLPWLFQPAEARAVTMLVLSVKAEVEAEDLLIPIILHCLQMC